MIKKLLKWQKQNELDDKSLAEILGYDQSMISYLRSGKRKMSVGKAKNLPAVTGGFITRDDILDYY